MYVRMYLCTYACKISHTHSLNLMFGEGNALVAVAVTHLRCSILTSLWNFDLLADFLMVEMNVL